MSFSIPIFAGIIIFSCMCRAVSKGGGGGGVYYVENRYGIKRNIEKAKFNEYVLYNKENNLNKNKDLLDSILNSKEEDFISKFNKNYTIKKLIISLVLWAIYSIYLLGIIKV